MSAINVYGIKIIIKLNVYVDIMSYITEAACTAYNGVYTPHTIHTYELHTFSALSALDAPHPSEPASNLYALYIETKRTRCAYAHGMQDALAGGLRVLARARARVARRGFIHSQFLSSF